MTPVRKFLPLCLYIAGACLLSTANAQFVQQGGKLVGTGPAGSAAQGQSVAVSADGNTAIVGGPYDNGYAGAAWVFTRTGGLWSQQGDKLVGTGGVGSPNQGYSVALSGDGNTVIVGGPYDNGYAGAAWVFTRTGEVWTQQGGKLAGTGALGSAQQGWAVALSGDGNTALVGGPRDSAGAGAAWVYTRSSGVWRQQGDKLTGTGALGSASQGASVALSADSNTAIVGGSLDNAGNGAAWVYTRTGGVWSQQGGKLAGKDAVGSAGQGYSVALSGDGNAGIVGGPSDNGYLGAAWVYTRTGGVWSQQGAKLAGIGADGAAWQGVSVALSADGNTALLGGPFDSASDGAAWLFIRAGGVWGQLGVKLTGTGADGSAAQGLSVALSGDGNTAVVGGTGDGGGAGASWVFANTGPAIVTDGVVNGASFLAGIAPGTWISIFGSNLSQSMRSWNYPEDFVGNNLPTQLDGVSVTVDGNPAYVYYISPSQLNVLAPAGTTRGSVAVQVTTAKGKSNVVSANQGTYSPALFTSSQLGGRYVAAVRADGTVLTNVAAKPGDIILLFGTGFGETTPPSPIGQIISAAPLANAVTVRIGGVIATTQFAGIAGAGLYQFNVVVPNVPDGDNLVVVEVSGTSSQPNAFLTVQK